MAASLGAGGDDGVGPLRFDPQGVADRGHDGDDLDADRAHGADRVRPGIAQARRHHGNLLVDADLRTLFGEGAANGRDIYAKWLVGQGPGLVDLAQQVRLGLAKSRQDAEATGLADCRHETGLAGTLHRSHQDGVANREHVADNCMKH